ncbi:hypothetical protein K491DRAFT_380269 [Lophiostoma macrostomum CBS 122681]|uniref:Uncharacterized protein n=1 Tax=Lophiostoma macrostomum CBS 122681 TaxID=1314788 RepID=A0A6A6TPC7_9PLEO|nr:hypothetical protein K491DRAFT_380269 [Lophiostoma macrostomum CBS 122681]
MNEVGEAWPARRIPSNNLQTKFSGQCGPSSLPGRLHTGRPHHPILCPRGSGAGATRMALCQCRQSAGQTAIAHSNARKIAIMHRASAASPPRVRWRPVPTAKSRTELLAELPAAVRQFLSDVVRHSSGRRSLQCELSSRTLREAVLLGRPSPAEPPANGMLPAGRMKQSTGRLSPRHRFLCPQRAPVVLCIALRRPLYTRQFSHGALADRLRWRLSSPPDRVQRVSPSGFEAPLAFPLRQSWSSHEACRHCSTGRSRAGRGTSKQSVAVHARWSMVSIPRAKHAVLAFLIGLAGDVRSLNSCSVAELAALEILPVPWTARVSLIPPALTPQADA